MNLFKIPPPPKQLIPTGFEKLLPNRLFDSQKEIDNFIKVEHPNGILIRKWKVESLAIEIAVPEIKHHTKEKKKK